MAEERKVTREELIVDLEKIIDEIRNGKYPAIHYTTTYVFNTRNVGSLCSISEQVSKQIIMQFTLSRGE